MELKLITDLINALSEVEKGLMHQTLDKTYRQIDINLCHLLEARP